MKTIENSLAVKTARMRSKQKKMSKHPRLKETEGLEKGNAAQRRSAKEMSRQEDSSTEENMESTSLR